MAYCQPGDTSELIKWLGNDGRLLPLFQRALGTALGATQDCDFVDLPSTRSGEVKTIMLSFQRCCMLILHP